MATLQQTEQVKKAIHKLHEVQEILLAVFGESNSMAINVCEDLESIIEDIEYEVDNL